MQGQPFPGSITAPSAPGQQRGDSWDLWGFGLGFGVCFFGVFKYESEALFFALLQMKQMPSVLEELRGGFALQACPSLLRAQPEEQLGLQGWPGRERLEPSHCCPS